MDFSQLGLMPALLRAISECSYTAPSPIQCKAIPPVLTGKDLLGCAQTGTGKTAAFSLPLLQRLANSKKRPFRVLVLTPTRELAIQIGESISAYAKHLPLSCCVIFGGVAQKSQIDQLKQQPDILVATPGRLNDLIRQKLLNLSNVEAFVLDEADRMLDMGFLPDVKQVLKILPHKRQTLLFSATMPKAIKELAVGMLSEPVFVEVAPPSTTAQTVEQHVFFTEKSHKRNLLAWVLKQTQPFSTLVFTRTKHGADRVARNLQKDGFSSAAIHGDKSQNARQRALTNFKSGKTAVLVATDIAARGIDINELSLVINFDLPNEPETYVHRIGRTGRAGQAGKAISFCSSDELSYLREIEKQIQKTIPVCTTHPYPIQQNTTQTDVLLNQRNEEPFMEERQTNSAMQKRRRRRSKKPTAQPATQQAARPRSQKPDRKSASAPRNETKPKEKPKAATEKVRFEKQKLPSAPPVQKKQQNEEEDAGLLLISRKAPAVKYANFEEYMKSHGSI